jgi:hypothetical protein
MKTFLDSSNEPLAEVVAAFQQRLEDRGWSVTEPAQANVALLLGQRHPQSLLNEFFTSMQWSDEDHWSEELIFRNTPLEAIYVFCSASSASSIVSVAPPETPIVGFSILPPITDSSILEITRPLRTPVQELEKARSFFESLGFTVSEVPDGPGLVQARIVACLANEAFSALAEGVADASTIDTAMKLGLNYPRGPLEWAELIGLKSILGILQGLQSEYGEDRYRPNPLLKRLVAAGMSIAQFEAWKQK